MDGHLNESQVGSYMYSLASLDAKPEKSEAMGTANDRATRMLKKATPGVAPGLQYIVVTPEHTVYEYAGGFADIRNQIPMDFDTTMMAYSMTKTFTAIAAMQLVESNQMGLDDQLDEHLPDSPYRGQGITVRQLLGHTSGMANPLPLRWVHLAEEAGSFNEDEAFAMVLRDNSNLAAEPGKRYIYSNLGYWILGKVVEKVSAQTYTEYVRQNILQPLGLGAEGMNFAISRKSRHAKGYIAKYSMMNLLRPFVLESKFVGGYEGRWLYIRDHYLNGPAYGGLIGTARGFSRLLQDQMQRDSVVLGTDAKGLLETQQVNGSGLKIPMTLGWHLGGSGGGTFLFKEGGGGGFHCEMRIYASRGIATVVMSNDAGFDSRAFLGRMDSIFLAGSADKPRH